MKKKYEVPTTFIIDIQAEGSLADIVVTSRDPQESEDLDSDGTGNKAPQNPSSFWG